MREEEKQKQIGELMQEFSQRRAEVAQLATKLAKAKEGCRVAATFLAYDEGYRIDGGRLYLGAGAHWTVCELLGHMELTELVEQLQAARSKEAELRAQLRSLGLANTID